MGRTAVGTRKAIEYDNGGKVSLCTLRRNPQGNTRANARGTMIDYCYSQLTHRSVTLRSDGIASLTWHIGHLLSRVLQPDRTPGNGDIIARQLPKSPATHSKGLIPGQNSRYQERSTKLVDLLRAILLTPIISTRYRSTIMVDSLREW